MDASGTPEHLRAAVQRELGELLTPQQLHEALCRGWAAMRPRLQHHVARLLASGDPLDATCARECERLRVLLDSALAAGPGPAVHDALLVLRSLLAAAHAHARTHAFRCRAPVPAALVRAELQGVWPAVEAACRAYAAVQGVAEDRERAAAQAALGGGGGGGGEQRERLVARVAASTRL